MEPLFEWKWAYWDESRARFVETPVWMTDDEARCDWFAYDDMRSRKLEHTRRDRHRGENPIVEPPESEVDWAKERRVRGERSRYGLPPFVTPTYQELRRTWREHPIPEVKCLALEVQTGRHELSELEAMVADALWHVDKESATIDYARKELRRIRRRLMQVVQRIGPVTEKR
ncbi:hypothetical protein G3N59_25325 [Paraburkholderia sp. Ac-20340]|uniref:hypothetical protein n=1 Tax=Paraburkholderia sp. Ac-20340 TaxID=2703888 RepID=UPI00197E5EDA|nr:hypothetical protein [Paraburkholderia sp. Ac-20340]MBN3856707.1 hypothetical protein [Paraburkholderia sp. Ac-20340]